MAARRAHNPEVAGSSPAPAKLETATGKPARSARKSIGGSGCSAVLIVPPRESLSTFRAEVLEKPIATPRPAWSCAGSKRACPGRGPALGRRRGADPRSGSGLMKFSGRPAKRGVLAEEEVGRLFKVRWADERARIGNLTAMSTGLRAGEVLALQVRDIGEDRLHVRHSWSGATA